MEALDWLRCTIRLGFDEFCNYRLPSDQCFTCAGEAVYSQYCLARLLGKYIRNLLHKLSSKYSNR